MKLSVSKVLVELDALFVCCFVARTKEPQDVLIGMDHDR